MKMENYCSRETGKLNSQILPYYVVEVAGSIPGISGLFIAGIFSAALSSMSANLNTVAGTIYEDFIRHRLYFLCIHTI